MTQTQTPATTAPAVQPPQGTALANIIPINSMEDISRLGIAVAKSGWFGSIPQSTGEMIAMTMLQERISPVTFKKKYHIINNSLSVTSRAIVSAFKRLGGKMKLHEVSKDKCDITFAYDGNELRYAVTLQEFIDNGVAVSSSGALKDNWAKFPMDMLYARCCSSAIRKVCPEADDGLYTSEEVADFDDTPAAAPREPVKIDKAEVVSRLAKETPVPAAPAPAAQEVVEAEVVEPPKPAPSATPMDDAKAKLAAARSAAKPNPFADPPSAPSSEAAACPIKGPFFNVPFADMEPDILQFVLLPDTAAKHPELTEAHISAAKSAARAKGMEV